MIPDHGSDSDSRPTVYVIEEDPATRDDLLLLLSTQDLDAVGFASATDFLTALATADLLIGPSCVVIDAGLTDMSAVELIGRIRRLGKSTGVILLASSGDIEGAVAAVRAGATDFIERTFVDARLVESVRQALAAAAGP